MKKQDNTVLFITTKNIDYLRNVQEIKMLRSKGYEVDLMYSNKKTYIGRISEIYKKLLLKQINKYEMIFIGFSPQLILPVWAWKFRHKKVYIDFFISVYDTLVNDRKVVYKHGVLSRILHWLDRKTLKLADGIYCDTNAHKEYFCHEFKAKKENLKVLYLEADKSIYYPRKANKPQNWSDKFIVLYFGSILPLQGVDVVLDAVRRLRDDTEIQFVVIGPINKKLKKVKSRSVRYYDWLTQTELAEMIAMSDVCLAGHFCSEIEKANRTIPGKAYIYAAMQKKMILGDTVANRELFLEDNEKIFFVPRGNAQELAKMILKIKSNCD